MISIKQIDFFNYRIAGTYSLSFTDPGNGYHLYGIVAENGTGKTTILNAITWCLYETEYQLKDANTALPIINAKKLKEMELNSSTDVCVRLTIQDEDKEIVFERRQKFIRSQNDDGTPKAIPNRGTEFVVTISDLSSSDGTKSFPNESGEYFVEEYFEKKIHEFFFFDGERLEDFFTSKKASSIQESVEAIAQISLLNTTVDHASTTEKTMRRQVSASKPNLKKLEAEVRKAEKLLQNDKEQISVLEAQKEELQSQKDVIDELLRENAVSATLQEQKKLLEAKLQEIKRTQDDLYKEKVKFAVRSAILIKFYPKIVKALAVIEEKGEKGDHSVYLTRKQLEQILKEATNHATNCPVCGSGIEMNQMLHIQNIISRQTVDDDAAMTLERIKEDLIAAKNEILGFRDVYQDFNVREITLQDEYSEFESKFHDVSERVTRLGTVKDEDGNIVDFEKLESDSRKLSSDIAGVDQAIGATKTLMGIHENDFNNKNAEYEDGVKRENDDVESQKIIDTLHFISEQLAAIEDELTTEVREMLESITKKIFMRVIKKKNTFGKISIDENYRLALYDEYGQIMTGSSCATEYMTLAYAYTLAIHEASGHNCPFVIDYPLGRISGDIRENTAEMLLETSKEKQIIMLLTEDEYSEKVRNIYEGKAVIKNIYLAEHERSWREA